MLKAEVTTQLSIDDVVYAVEDCSTAIQNLVEVMDSWRQRELDAQNDLLLVRAGIRDIQNSILATFKKEQEEAMAASTEASATETPAE